MPWGAITVEKIREIFVAEAKQHKKSFSALCQSYGISRPTGYKWVRRAAKGLGYQDQSHRPMKTPANKIAAEVEELIVETRRRMPGIGAVKLKRILENNGNKGLPSHTTVNAVLRRNHLIRREASEAARPNQRFEYQEANEMWQADFKGSFVLGDKTRCYPLSIIDDHSRYCISADAKTNERRAGTQESFEQAFQQYGKPKIILCDNGNPWGASQSSGYSKFEIWLMEHGILVMHIRPKHPKTQGKVERFNGSYKAERLKYHIPENMNAAIQDRLDYQYFYNHIRPHHALGLDVPADHFKPSPRRFSEQIPEWVYPDDCIVRMIKSTGFLTYQGQGYFLSEGFGNKEIGLRPSTKDPDIIYLYFREFQIGCLNQKHRMIISRAVYLIEGDPRLNQV